MWIDGGKYQAWRGLIFVVGFLVVSLAGSGASWRSIGSDFAEAATQARKATVVRKIHSARLARHARSRKAHRHAFSWRRSVHPASPMRHKGKPPQPRAPTAPPPAPNAVDLADMAAASAPAPVTVTILAGNIDGTAAHIAADISTVLDSDDLRVLTVLGKGSVQNLRDISTSPYLDLALVPSDALEEAWRLGFGGVAKSVTYIAPLYNEEVQILARGDIATVSQLDGKKVGVGVAGSGTADRASLVFDRLGIKPEMINLDQPSALALLQRGALDAVVFADGKPIPALAALPPQSNLHFVAIPYVNALQDAYYPARLLPRDYPNLVKPGSEVETIAIGTVLAAYNAPEGSPRYRKLARFTRAFFREFDYFLKPGRQPKWREVNFAADAPGWERFKPAQDWLARSESSPTTAAR